MHQGLAAGAVGWLAAVAACGKYKAPLCPQPDTAAMLMPRTRVRTKICRFNNMAKL